ncbi:hypothetical protein [Deinococcus arenicola]|uniref:Uncharacterized protein n=1 Tax=Deinococcus arenicola TaxID=2994950 RepID=A0ABU4DUH1_9DEIO|nr:hypothetical protein [Deinococcus sp. ZS9-10]MDV6376089.1 hypothetical protein [Deinococcus sp. ZS9-10]
MNAPRPTLTPSRLNVGGYGVTVRYFRAGYLGMDAEDIHAMKAFGFPGVNVWRGGKVDADGSLTVDPEVWRARHYRRAVMGGAGVYRLGLWAMLAHRQTDAQAEGGAALGGNDGGTLARFALAHRPPRTPDRVYLPGSSGEPTFRQIRARYGEQVSQAVASAAVRGGLELLDRSGLRQILIDAFSTPVIDPEYRKRIEALASGVNDEINAALNVQAGQLKERAQRRAFRRAAREVLRLLGRMAARRVPQRPPMRVPRPLYARAVPPAAPLAPPAL